MNAEERKYRFTEIMSALEMLPDLCENEDHLEIECECYDGNTPDTWKLPNGSEGIDDANLRDALLCQIIKRDNDNFIMKTVGVFLNTAMSSIVEVEESADIKDTDLELMATTANLLWAVGNASGLFNAMGMLGRLCIMHNREIPEIATITLKGNKHAKAFGKIDPYALLEGNLTRGELIKVLKSSADEADNE